MTDEGNRGRGWDSRCHGWTDEGGSVGVSGVCSRGAAYIQSLNGIKTWLYAYAGEGDHLGCWKQRMMFELGSWGRYVGGVIGIKAVENLARRWLRTNQNVDGALTAVRTTPSRNSTKRPHPQVHWQPVIDEPNRSSNLLEKP